MKNLFIQLPIISWIIPTALVSCSRDEIIDPNKNKDGVAKPPNIIVIFTDDQGYADLSIQGQVDDIYTPNIDQLAKNGVRFTSGYVTAPVSGPSRVGLITGKYQQRFGVESNGTLPNFNSYKDVPTLPQRLKERQYVTGLVGKAHFGRTIASMGFDEYFMHQTGPWDPIYISTHNVEGVQYPSPQTIDLRTENKYRLEEETKRALNFIENHADERFFLYLAYTAPHVPLAAPQKYIDRFSSVEDKDRQLCLAMMSAIDDGVGEIIKLLKDKDLEQETIIFYVSDNGGMPNPENEGYDASLNIPLSGEKGLLLEGGIRVPWVVQWKGTIPGGQIVDTPIITLDISPTVLSIAGSNKVSDLDGINLLPYLTDPNKTIPERSLFWYSRAQQAVRKGSWKLFKRTDKDFSYLVNLDEDITEKHDMSKSHPEIVENLTKELEMWLKSMQVSPKDDTLPPSMEKRLFYYLNK
jgi:uncharacterized sulfatase